MLILDYSNLNNKCIHPIFSSIFRKKAEKCKKKHRKHFKQIYAGLLRPKFHLHMNLNLKLNISCNLSQTLVEKGCLASAELDNV